MRRPFGRTGGIGEGVLEARVGIVLAVAVAPRGWLSGLGECRAW